MNRRVLHVAAMPYPTRQGTQASIRAMLRAHVSLGDETHLLAYAHGDGRKVDDGVHMHRAPALAHDQSLSSGPSLRKIASDALMLRTLRNVVRDVRPTRILAHHVEAAALCALANLPEWTFVAHTALGAELPGYFGRLWAPLLTQSGDALEAELVRRAPRVLAISPLLARHLEAVHGRPVSTLPIPWQIMLRRKRHDRAQVVARLGLPTEKRIALYAGNLDAYQGLPVVFEAFKSTRLANVHWVVATNDDRSLPSHVHAQRFALDEESSAIIDAADVALAPRKTLGGVAIKLLEYVAHEVPSVAARFATGGYDLGANVNVVENDVGAWVTAIEHAVNAPRQRSDTFEHPRWSAAHYANVAFA